MSRMLRRLKHAEQKRKEKNGEPIVEKKQNTDQSTDQVHNVPEVSPITEDASADLSQQEVVEKKEQVAQPHEDVRTHISEDMRHNETFRHEQAVQREEVEALFNNDDMKITETSSFRIYNIPFSVMLVVSVLLFIFIVGTFLILAKFNMIGDNKFSRWLNNKQQAYAFIINDFNTPDMLDETVTTQFVAIESVVLEQGEHTETIDNHALSIFSTLRNPKEWAGITLNIPTAQTSDYESIYFLAKNGSDESVEITVRLVNGDVISSYSIADVNNEWEAYLLPIRDFSNIDAIDTINKVQFAMKTITPRKKWNVMIDNVELVKNK